MQLASGTTVIQESKVVSHTQPAEDVDHPYAKILNVARKRSGMNPNFWKEFVRGVKDGLGGAQSDLKPSTDNKAQAIETKAWPENLMLYCYCGMPCLPPAIVCYKHRDVVPPPITTTPPTNTPYAEEEEPDLYCNEQLGDWDETTRTYSWSTDDEDGHEWHTLPQ